MVAAVALLASRSVLVVAQSNPAQQRPALRYRDAGQGAGRLECHARGFNGGRICGQHTRFRSQVRRATKRDRTVHRVHSPGRKDVDTLVLTHARALPTHCRRYDIQVAVQLQGYEQSAMCAISPEYDLGLTAGSQGPRQRIMLTLVPCYHDSPCVRRPVTVEVLAERLAGGARRVSVSCSLVVFNLSPFDLKLELDAGMDDSVQELVMGAMGASGHHGGWGARAFERSP